MSFKVQLIAFILKIRSRLKPNDKKYGVIARPRSKGNVNIIYLLHDNKKSRNGGDKVIYKQSEVIKSLNQNDFSSSVLHVENTSIQLDWFEHEVKFKKDHNFDPNNDFVVIPEILLLTHAKRLTEIGVSYAIFVQNGYLMDGYVTNYDEIALACKNASIILAISDDSADCIITAYPWAADKIIRIICSIDADKFVSAEKKENIITYMPRKLARHANLIKFFLNENLPESWKLKEIYGLNEDGVIELLGKSKIFLSLSELEGLGLPPAEAALAGNFVIGYAGNGGKEYWKAPIFTEIQCGDIKKFVDEILKKIDYLNDASSYTDFDSSRIELGNKYSKNAEKQSLLTFLHKADGVLNAKNV